MDKPTCETCPFWCCVDPDLKATTYGECRVLPPQFYPRQEPADEDDDYQYVGFFPETEYDMWCGKHPDFGNWVYFKSVEASRARAEAFRVSTKTNEP